MGIPHKGPWVAKFAESFLRSRQYAQSQDHCTCNAQRIHTAQTHVMGSKDARLAVNR